MHILLFDMDGVLVKPLAYHLALRETVRLADQRLGVRSALAAQQAKIAVRAFLHDTIDSKQTLARNSTEQRTQRADETAEEARFPQVHQDEEQKDHADPERADKNTAFDTGCEFQ